MPKEPRRSNNQRLLPIPTVGSARRQPPIMQEHTTKKGPTPENNSAGVNAPMLGGVGHLGNPQSRVHPTIIASTHQNDKTGMNYLSRGGVGNPISQQEKSTRIVSNNENNIGVNYLSRGGVGNPINTQDNSTRMVSNYENNTSMGLNVPSLGVIIRPQTPQGHGANVVSTPENNTTTDAPVVGTANIAIRMARENHVAEIQPPIVNALMSSG
ncbi:hypothetical protein CFC21_103321 [Triticum aestivum]|uniref:Uncharacterized protein n=2 Tax=Triticum aestivum TaxID=4565 RepID=A0A3B6SKT4_WHEAT|nr:uncharacterized protein LOC119341577 isoform X1 [Triticum dicoccoides]XP_044435968.1 uncharacterized protein LOC123162257 [Triticum aestivum]KAF7102137.1 hypothetical protein CFC21_103321 [Triticum aestivum]